MNIRNVKEEIGSLGNVIPFQEFYENGACAI